MGLYALAFGYKLLFQDHTNFISQHISNFAITGLIISIEMFQSIRNHEYSDNSFRALMVISIVLNILVESISLDEIKLPLGVRWVEFNVADPLDAVFGIVAVLLFMIVIVLCTKNKKKNQA